MTTPSRIVKVAVVGAGSQIGGFLVRRLKKYGAEVCAIGRQDRVTEDYVVHKFDETLNRFEPPLNGVDAIITLAPLPTINLVMKMAAALGTKRLIAFGSTGRLFKTESPSARELDFVAEQLEGEKCLLASSQSHEVAWTLFRPTMIYGAGADLNVTFIATMIRRFKFFPMPWGANGMRQPVHVDDLAAACVTALNAEPTFGRAYNLGGGEQLTYSEMVGRIFLALGIRPRIVHLPTRAFRVLISLLRLVPRYRFVDPAMVLRMSDDLVVDLSEAVRDFKFAPRDFRPTFSEISNL